MITAKERHDLLLADRSRDADVIRGAIERVQEQNPSATLFDCEMCFRDAAAQSYLVMDAEGMLHVVIGIQAWKAKMIEMGEVGDHANYDRLRSHRGNAQ